MIPGTMVSDRLIEVRLIQVWLYYYFFYHLSSCSPRASFCGGDQVSTTFRQLCYMSHSELNLKKILSHESPQQLMQFGLWKIVEILWIIMSCTFQMVESFCDSILSLAKTIIFPVWSRSMYEVVRTRIGLDNTLILKNILKHFVTNLSLAMCLSTTAQTGSSKEPSNEIHKRLPYISHSACLEKLERTRDGRITAAWEGVKLSDKCCAERYKQYTWQCEYRIKGANGPRPELSWWRCAGY